MVTLAFNALTSAKMSYSSTLREAGIMTGTSSNVTVVRIGGVPGSDYSLLILSLMSSRVPVLIDPAPVFCPRANLFDSRKWRLVTRIRLRDFLPFTIFIATSLISPATSFF